MTAGGREIEESLREVQKRLKVRRHTQQCFRKQVQRVSAIYAEWTFLWSILLRGTKHPSAYGYPGLENPSFATIPVKILEISQVSSCHSSKLEDAETVQISACEHTNRNTPLITIHTEAQNFFKHLHSTFGLSIFKGLGYG